MRDGVGMGKELNDLSREKKVIYYRFFNPSLGPTYGKRYFKICLEGNKVVSIEEIGKSIKGTPGLKILLDALRGERDPSLKYRYTSHGHLKEICRETRLPGTFFCIYLEREESAF